MLHHAFEATPPPPGLLTFSDGSQRSMAISSWQFLPSGTFLRNPEMIFQIDKHWLIYLLPAILRDALEETVLDEKNSLSLHLEKLFCAEASSLPFGLLSNEQRHAIRSCCEYLTAIGQLSEVSECLEEAFRRYPFTQDRAS